MGVRAGDSRARERLLSRFLPPLRRFAHGRLPAGSRDLLDTDDLVQVTLIRALSHLETFESQREGSLLAYLRQIVLNQVRDAARGVARRPGRDPLPEEAADRCRSPLEETVGRETMEAYDAALADLSEEQRHAVILRIELGYGYSQIAEAVGSPTPNAARMLVTRALLRLAQAMDGHREGR